MIAALIALAAAQAAAATPPAPAGPGVCDNKPVLMIVSGPTLDRARMIAYAKAIADSGMYQKLGGYYLNGAAPLDVLEGDPPKGYTNLIVRFPCLANARAFWHSKEYQEKIKPLRLNPSAGDYLVVVYPEVPVRADMAGKVGDSGYKARFTAEGIEQVKP